MAAAEGDGGRLIFYAKTNQVDRLLVELGRGAPVQAANSFGQTALHVAALWGRMESAQILVDAGADVNAQNEFSGATPLHCAAKSNRNLDGCLACAKFLLGAGADVNVLDFDNRPAWKYTENKEMLLVLGQLEASTETPPVDDSHNMLQPESSNLHRSSSTLFNRARVSTQDFLFFKRHGSDAFVSYIFGEDLSDGDDEACVVDVDLSDMSNEDEDACAVDVDLSDKNSRRGMDTGLSCNPLLAYFESPDEGMLCNPILAGFRTTSPKKTRPPPVKEIKSPRVPPVTEIKSPRLPPVKETKSQRKVVQ